MSTCPLCRREDRELVDSHLLSRQVNRRGRNPKLANPNPRVVTETKTFPSSKQVVMPFLCDDCEDLLSKRGETYAVGASWRKVGDFPLQDMLLAEEPYGGEDQIYAASEVPDVDVAKLVHYGAGVFWKAAAGSWPSLNPEPVHIDLGPYEEPLRRFVIGEDDFPDAMTMLLFVSPMRAPEQPMPLSAQPRTIHPRKRDCHMHFFIALGLEYRLYVGKRIDDHVKKLCFVRSPEHYILMSMSEEATAREAHDPKRPIAFKRPPRRAWRKRPRD